MAAAWTNGVGLFYDGLEVTLVFVGRHILFTRRAFAVAALVSLDGEEALAQSLTIGATLMGTAHGGLWSSGHTAGTGMGLVVEETLRPKKDTMAFFARYGGRTMGGPIVQAARLVATGTFTARATVVL